MSLVSRSLICFLLLRSGILLTAAVGAHCMSQSDDDRYPPSGHRLTNQNTPSPECRASEMQYESRAVSLFALRSLSRPHYSRLAAWISHSLSRCSSGRDFRAKERLLAVYFSDLWKDFIWWKRPRRTSWAPQNTLVTSQPLRGDQQRRTRVEEIIRRGFAKRNSQSSQ